jgi:asparagine synthase (glutamine-hydrolysing)
MCGICGHVGPPRPELVARMLSLLEHRGPDDEGVHSTDDATIAVRRLAIIDPAGGHQPALSEDTQIAAVLNGELYNYRDLRDLLERKGHRFRSESDTEILPHLYEEFGVEFLSLLRGMFALAVWDGRERRLLLARDRAGEKPLLYAEPTSGLVFASELTALLEIEDLSRELDATGLRLYLQLHYVPGARTILAGVRRLPAGHRLVADSRGIRVERYWDLVPSDASYFVSREGAAQELRVLLERAVAAQLHADRPIGALLSGGIDSAGIVALMARAAVDRPRTFTVGFEDASFDERPQARRIAAALQTNHTELLVEKPTFEDLEQIIRSLDEPIGDQAAVPTYLIARVASEYVTVVLTGEGGDELFGGYPRYRWYALAEHLQSLPGPLRAAARIALERSGRAREAKLLLGAMSPLARHLAWTRVIAPAEIDELLHPEFAAEDRDDALDHLESSLGAWSGTTSLEQALVADFKTWLPDDILTKADRMTMASSIEARAPYLDSAVIEFASALPASARVRGRTTKPLLREALRGALPEEFLGRTKHAFRVPVEGWIEGHLAAPLRELLLDRDAATGSIFRKEAIVRLLDERGREAGRRIWTVAVLELWLKTVLASTSGALEPVRS